MCRYCMSVLYKLIQKQLSKHFFSSYIVLPTPIFHNNQTNWVGIHKVHIKIKLKARDKYSILCRYIKCVGDLFNFNINKNT